MTTFKQQEIEKFKNQITSIESKNRCKVLLAFVRGSHMYGTFTDKSDVDITFVYQQPTSDILRGDYKEQITVGGNDIVGYEIQRFINLLGQNNPNILEALDIPEDCLIYKDEIMEPILQQHLWLSKLTEKTILGYADSQIKKATGLKKKMNNPMVEKKDILDFCYIIYDGKSYPVRKEFSEEELSRAGLVNIPNSKGIYGLYIDEQKNQNFRGILKDENSTQLRLSSVPKEFAEIYHCETMYYNQDGYEVWRKEYESYQKWLTERNEERHTTNSEHGKNYDSKNMMHLFRLLSMAFKISIGEKLTVREDDVEWLMEIRRGEIEYDELIEYSDMLFNYIKSNFKTLELQDSPDVKVAKELIILIRERDI